MTTYDEQLSYWQLFI